VTRLEVITAALANAWRWGEPDGLLWWMLLRELETTQ